MAIDFIANNPEVWVNGVKVPHLQCMSVQDNVNESMSRSDIKFAPMKLVNSVNTPQDYIGPTALSLVGYNNYYGHQAGPAPDDVLKAGQRVVIVSRSSESYVYPSDILFAGMLANRTDTSNPDSLMWEAVCDKWILGGAGGINIRGALVYATENSFQYAPTYLPVFNPDGQANCIGVQATVIVNGVTEYNEIVPVFSQYATRLRTNSSTTVPDLNTTQPTYWTPRRAMQYLRMLLILNADATVNGQPIRGIEEATWRTINPPSGARMKFSKESIDNIHAWDPTQPSTDLADSLMQTVSIQGNKSLKAINDVLRTMSTMGFRLTYSCTSHNPATTVSNVDFFIKAVADTMPEPDGVSLNIQSSGTPDSNNVCKFVVSDRKEDCAESMVADGQAVKVESSFAYDPTSMDSEYTQLIPAWSEAQETAFKLIIDGGGWATKTDGWAYIPRNLDDIAWNAQTWIPCDGQNGHPLAWARHETAVTLARKMFPEVLVAFRVRPSATQMQGFQSAFAGNQYPLILSTKAISKEQEQPIFSTVETTVNRYDDTIVTKFPIRIAVENVETDWSQGDMPINRTWVEVTINPGIRIDPNGIIYLEGLAEKVDGQKECVYTGFLTTKPMYITKRKIKMNASIKLDHRVYGYYTLGNQSGDWFPPKFDTTLATAMGGLPQAYLSTRETYSEIHQVNSEPSSFAEFQAAMGSQGPQGYISSPLNRILPPTDGRSEITKLARRRTLYMAQTKRDAKYTIPGINKIYRAGVWINTLDDQNGYYVPIQSAIQSVTFDFNTPETNIGGVICDIE